MPSSSESKSNESDALLIAPLAAASALNWTSGGLANLPASVRTAMPTHCDMPGEGCTTQRQVPSISGASKKSCSSV